MTADERLRLIRSKIEWAKQHIRHLDFGLSAFYKTKPYEVATKRNAQTGQLIYYIASVRKTPIEVSNIVGDVLQNLRSALDHLAYQLCLVGPDGKAGNPGYHIYFPVFDNAAKYKARRSGQIKGLRQEAIDAIDAIKPYKGGNDTLWRLHKLNNIDKHRQLITVGSAFSSVNVSPVMNRLFREVAPKPYIPVPPIFLRPANRLCPLKVGDELFIDATDAEMNQEMDFRFDIAFSEPQICESQPVVETLQHMLDLVDNLISSFRPLLV